MKFNRRVVQMFLFPAVSSSLCLWVVGCSSADYRNVNAMRNSPEQERANPADSTDSKEQKVKPQSTSNFNEIMNAFNKADGPRPDTQQPPEGNPLQDGPGNENPAQGVVADPGTGNNDNKNSSNKVSDGSGAVPPSLENPSEDVCTKGAPLQLGAEVPGHWDQASVPSFNFSDPMRDVDWTQPIEIDLDTIEGGNLPLEDFELDDIAFIVPADENTQQIGSFMRTSDFHIRNIHVPDRAVFLFNADDPNFASGAVDSSADTVYKFKDKSVTIPSAMRGNEHIYTVKEVADLGMPLMAHNAISLQKLIDLGYSSNGILKFRIVHVSHNWGFLKAKLEIHPCEE